MNWLKSRASGLERYKIYLQKLHFLGLYLLLIRPDDELSPIQRPLCRERKEDVWGAR